MWRRLRRRAEKTAASDVVGLCRSTYIRELHILGIQLPEPHLAHGTRPTPHQPLPPLRTHIRFDMDMGRCTGCYGTLTPQRSFRWTLFCLPLLHTATLAHTSRIHKHRHSVGTRRRRACPGVGSEIDCRTLRWRGGCRTLLARRPWDKHGSYHRFHLDVTMLMCHLYRVASTRLRLGVQ